MKTCVLVLLAASGVAIALALFGEVWLKPRVLGHYFMIEYGPRAEFAEKATSLTCPELRLFALTSYIAFLEEHRGLLPMQTNDFNSAVFFTHGRLFYFYTRMSNEVNAEQHFVAASNAFYLLRGKPLEKALLLTNVAFRVEPR